MLKVLTIKNLVLIEACEVEFAGGLNILSGETGAGKTVLLEALALLLGQRADSGCIRHGMDKAVVEGAFEVENAPLVIDALDAAGIEFDPKEYVVLRREMVRQGKSRAFVNCQMVPLTVMQNIGAYLVDRIGQHAHQELRQAEAQRDLLDLCASAHEERALFQTAWKIEKQIHDELEELKIEASKRERALETYAREKKELEEAAFQDGEEEKLFEEYNRLAHTQELMEKCSRIEGGLEEISRTVARYKSLCEEVAKMDSALQECVQFLHEVGITIRETTLSIGGYLARLENDPERFAFLEERLKLMDRMKRKYGNPVSYLEELQGKCQHLEHLDEEILQKEEALKAAELNTHERVEVLSNKRKVAAVSWELEIEEVLRALNMPSVSFKIHIQKIARTISGEDLVQFWLGANKGEESALVKENASGGELSRLLFAIKTTLAASNPTATLVFDEIDANVGGKTATILAEKLKELGACRQVLCITHFPQVAAQADHHLCVFKEEVNGRTLARITTLTPEARTQELARMLGQ